MTKKTKSAFKNMTTKQTTLSSDLQLAQKKSPPQLKKSESDTSTRTLVTLKIPFPVKENANGVDITQRTIKIVNAVVVNTNRITTPVTFQFRPSINGSNFSVSRSQQKSSKHWNYLTQPLIS